MLAPRYIYICLIGYWISKKTYASLQRKNGNAFIKFSENEP